MLAVFVPLALGALTWTFLEYVMHRYLGHDRRFVKKTPFGAEHTAHHSRGNYFAPTWKKASFLALVAAVIGVPAYLVLAWPGLFYATGLVGSYLLYEVMHRLLHVWAGVGPWARWARRHHFYHHFHDPSRNHGVTTPLWDLVFGTYRKIGADQIVVPRKLAMPWLVDDTTGDVHRPLAPDYALRP